MLNPAPAAKIKKNPLSQVLSRYITAATGTILTFLWLPYRLGLGRGTEQSWASASLTYSWRNCGRTTNNNPEENTREETEKENREKSVAKIN